MNTFERFWCCWLFLRAIKTNKNSVFKSINSFIIQLIKVSFLFWPFLVFLQSFLAVPAGQAIECIFSSLLKPVVQPCSDYIKEDVNCKKKMYRVDSPEQVSDYLFIPYPLPESPGTGTQRSLSRGHCNALADEQPHLFPTAE